MTPQDLDCGTSLSWVRVEFMQSTTDHDSQPIEIFKKSCPVLLYS